MRVLHLGLIVVITVAALLGSAFWVMAQSAPPAQEPPPQSTPENTVETSATDLLGLLISPTVGISPSSCAITSTVHVLAGMAVYYCFTLRNTGDETLTFHHIESSRGLNQELQGLTLAPGETRNTVQALPSIPFTDSATVDVTTFFTWTARPQSNSSQVSATGIAQMNVVTPAAAVVKTVGQDRNSCGTDRVLRIPTGSTAFFCITIQNTGDITLTNHTIDDPLVGISNASFTSAIPPGQRLSIIQSNLASLGISSGSLERPNVTSVLANSVSYTGRAENELTVTSASTATVDIGNTTVRFVKTVSTQPEDCNGTSSITVNPGTRVYYCVIIENTGSVALTQHHIVEQYLSIDVTFDYTLNPGETLRVTNDFLARNNQPIVFGPFEVDPKFGPNNVIGNTMTYIGTSPDGFTAAGSAGATVTYPPTPTATFTSRPDATSTATPPFFASPTFTLVPPTPTPTLTPTFTPITPSPTPTRSYAISLLETPTPRSQIAGLPGQPGAATPIPGQLPPLLDPVVATATQLAIDATATQIVVESIALSAQETMIAQGPLPQSPLATPLPFAPESPLATPTLDPSIFGDGASAGVTDVPTETATALPIETPTETTTVQEPMSGANVTVLPGPVTAVVATETPAIMVVIVTNTPEAGATPPEATAQEQRPIVYPTPTPTPDFVMAAARTFDVAVTTMGWLWFLVGSLIFFVTAGVVAGLFFRQSEVHRFDLPEPEYRLEEEPTVDSSRKTPQSGQRADDDWPADLP